MDTNSLDGFYNRFQRQSSPTDTLPPVEKWSPELCGDISIYVDRQGKWHHDGDIIRRQSLVDLFSTILKREGDDFYLVTPVEKWRIQVDVAPLLVIASKVEQRLDSGQVVNLQTQQGQWIEVNAQHPISVQLLENIPYPLVHVRSGLNALIARNVYYELANHVIEYSEENIPLDITYCGKSMDGGRLGEGTAELGIISNRCFFPIEM